MEVTRHYATFKRYHLFVSKWFSVYLHVYYAERELSYHDHPWWNVTIRLWGRFFESQITNYMSLDRGKETNHVSPRFTFRRATTAHKMVMCPNKILPGKLVTLFITGPEWNVIGGRA